LNDFPGSYCQIDDWSIGSYQEVSVGVTLL
jgi:hypothetical protein